MIRTSRRDVILATALVVAGGALVAGGSLAASADAPLPAVSPNEFVAQVGIANAALPERFSADRDGIGAIVSGTGRLLVEADDRTLWAAVDKEGNVCLVIELRGSSTLSCDRAERVAAHGLPLFVEEAGVGRLDAYLVPEEISRGALPSGWVVVAPGLLQTDWSKGKVEPISFGARGDRAAFELLPFEPDALDAGRGSRE